MENEPSAPAVTKVQVVNDPLDVRAKQPIEVRAKQPLDVTVANSPSVGLRTDQNEVRVANTPLPVEVTNQSHQTSLLPPIFKSGARVSCVFQHGKVYTSLDILEIDGEWVRAMVTSGGGGQTAYWVHVPTFPNHATPLGSADPEQRQPLYWVEG